MLLTKNCLFWSTLYQPQKTGIFTFIAVGISNLACHLLHEKKIIIKEKVYDVFQQIIIFKQLSTVLYKPMQLSAPSPRLQRSKELVEPLGLYKVRV